MSTKTHYRLAASLMGWVCLFGLGLAIIVFGLAWSIGWEFRSSLLLLIIPGAFIVYNLALGIVLRKYQQRRELFVTRSGRTIEPSSVAILGLTWGLYWRATILNAVATLINSGVAQLAYGGDSGALWIVQSAVSFAALYLAGLWLLRWQMGSINISFDAVPFEKLYVEVVDANSGDAISAVKSGTTAILTTAAVVSYFGVGLLQLAAVYGFFNDYWGWWAIPSFFAAMFVAYIPIIGAIAGVITATMVWQWDRYWAALLFFFPIVLFVLSLGIAGISSLFGGHRQ